MDGIWAVTDIISRSNHKPTVRRLIVPGHNHDAQRRKDVNQHPMNQLQKMMMMMQGPTNHHHHHHQQQILHSRSAMPMARSGSFWR